MERNKARLAFVMGRGYFIDQRRVVGGALRDAGFVFTLANRTDHKHSLLTEFRFKRYLIKMCHSFEGVKTIVDLSVRQPPYSLSAKLLHIKRGHHRSKNHCASHRALVNLFLARQVPHETT